jgi:hypothetical protein
VMFFAFFKAFKQTLSITSVKYLDS